MLCPEPYGAMRLLQYNTQRRAVQQMVAETRRRMNQQGCMARMKCRRRRRAFGDMGGQNSGWGPCRQQSGSHEPTPAGYFGGFSPALRFFPNDLENMRVPEERYGND
ncbi:hypothetical protein BCY84_05219 [Trypanosoma cruzi cruzi]|nr:hypothetical protein BCY84_05219 [Trypanosoma cruzi cruzi]